MNWHGQALEGMCTDVGHVHPHTGSTDGSLKHQGGLVTEKSVKTGLHKTIPNIKYMSTTTGLLDPFKPSE